MSTQRRGFLIQLIEAYPFLTDRTKALTFNAALRNLFEHDSSSVETIEQNGEVQLYLTAKLFPADAAGLFQEWHDYLKSAKMYPPTSYQGVILPRSNEVPTTSVLVVDYDPEGSGIQIQDQQFFTEVYPSTITLADDQQSVRVQFGYAKHTTDFGIELFAREVIGALQNPFRQLSRVAPYITAEQMQAAAKTVTMPKDSAWKVIERGIQSYDYPSEEIAEFGGIPADTCYAYVSSSFLNGLVNYAGIKQAFLINRYGLQDRDGTGWDKIDKTLPPLEQYRKMAEHLGELPHLSQIGTVHSDDAILFGETEHDYWVFWYDCDCSDCVVWRLSKKTFKDLSYEEVVKARLDHFIEVYNFWQHDTSIPEAIIVEIKPKNGRFGWISS